MRIDTWAGSEKELCPCGCLNHLYVAFLTGFLWPIILFFKVLSLCFAYLRVLPCVYALQPRQIVAKKPMSRLTSLLLDLQGAFLCARIGHRGSLLDFEKRKYVVSYLYRAQLLFFILEYPLRINSSYSACGPVSNLVSM